MSSPVTIATAHMDHQCHQRVCDACEAPGYQCIHFPSSNDLLSALGLTSPTVLVMQLNERAVGPLSLQRSFRTASDPLSVVYIAARPLVQSVVRAMQLGAITVLPANCSADELSNAVDRAAGTYRLRADWINEVHSARQRIELLSNRRRDVMLRVVAGQTNRTIAEELGISTKTVEKHRHEVHCRTQQSTLAELIQLKLRAEQSLETAYSLTVSGDLICH